MASVTLESTKFNDFIRILSNFKDLCNDVDITEGIIRQYTNDKGCVFEIDMTPLLSTLSIPIVNLKQKIDLLKSFIGQDVSIESNDEDKKIIVSDKYSSLSISFPTKDFIQNKFISSKEFNKKITTDPEDLILDTTFSKIITDRIRIASSSSVFNVKYLNFIFTEDKASVKMSTASKDQTITLANDLICEKELEATSALPIIPFVIDHDGNTMVKMYENKTSKTKSAMNQFSTTISDINVTMYCPSILSGTNDDEEE